MVEWAAYLLAVSAIMSLAGLILERAVRRYPFATRWIWACALGASLALPVVLSSTASRAATTAAVRSLPAAALSESARTAGPEWISQVPVPLVAAESPQLDAIVADVWIVSSGVVAATLLGGWWYGRRRRRGWRRSVVDNTKVFVAPDAGPATVGLLHPQIVVPEWLLRAAPETLSLVLAHERSHAEARDPGLLVLGLGLAILAPWNPLLWWQVRRLRLAIEVDCDRRVLRAGHDAWRYAQTLVDVSTRRPAYSGGLAASHNTSSAMERRILLMNTPRIHGWRASAAAGALLSVAVATATLLISPPAIPLARAATPAAAAPAEPTDLSRYAGDYEFADNTVQRIELRDGQLAEGNTPLTHLSGQQFRIGKVGCCSPDGDAYVRFATDAAGHVIGAVFQQNGVATSAPRIGAERARAIDNAIKERVRAQAPARGSEAALRHLITGIEAGNPDYAELSPQLAAGTKASLSDFQATMKPWGTLRSIEFRGVESNGWDKYVVRFDRGSASWSISVDSYGLIVGAGTTPLENSKSQ